MEQRRSKSRHTMLRIDLAIVGILAIAVCLFALFYAGGGASILSPAIDPEASPAPNTSPLPSPSPSSTPAPVSTEGRLIPYLENGLWGYKNTAGQVAIEPRFSAAYEFDGDTAFAAENGYYGLLAKNGVWVVEAVWEGVEAFSE